MCPTQQGLLQSMLVKLCTKLQRAIQRRFSPLVPIERNGSPVYVASTVHKELADLDACVMARMLRQLANAHAGCNETYMEKRAACFVAISDRRLSKRQASHQAVQVIVSHKFGHLGVVVDLIIRQDDRMHRCCPIKINALTKVGCNARPTGASSMLYIQCRACFCKHSAIA